MKEYQIPLNTVLILVLCQKINSDYNLPQTDQEHLFFTMTKYFALFLILNTRLF